MNSAGTSYPRRLDADLASRVSAITLDRYRQAAKLFVGFCLEFDLSPVSALDFDEALIECKVAKNPKKAALENLVAAVEFFSHVFEAR